MFSGARNIMFCGNVSSQHFCDCNGIYEVFLWGAFANSKCSDHFRQFFFDLLTDYSINLGHEICDNAFYCSHVSFVAAKVLSCGRRLSGLEVLRTRAMAGVKRRQHGLKARVVPLTVNRFSFGFREFLMRLRGIVDFRSTVIGVGLRDG